MNRYLVGCDVLGASGKPRVPWHLLGATYVGEAGLDINAVNKAVRGARPLSQAQAQAFIAQAIKLLNLANSDDTAAGATARRNKLIDQLNNISSMMRSNANLDPLPEQGAQNSPAEILRNAVLAAVAEFNAVAEGQATLQAARSQIYSDMVDTAKEYVATAGNAIAKASEEVAWYAEVTTWVVLGLVAVVGYGAYKIITSPTGTSLAGAYLGGFGARR